MSDVYFGFMANVPKKGLSYRRINRRKIIHCVTLAFSLYKLILIHPFFSWNDIELLTENLKIEIEPEKINKSNNLTNRNHGIKSSWKGFFIA